MTRLPAVMNWDQTQAVMAGAADVCIRAGGGGELGAGVDIAICSGTESAGGSAGVSPVLLIATSLSLFGFISLLLFIEMSLTSLELSPLVKRGFSPPFQDGISQVMPVKLLTENPLRAHFRHGLPERSSALRLALMAPAFVLGFSLWAAPVPAGRLLVVVVWSMVPSSL